MDMKVPELRHLLGHLGLPRQGPKLELVERLLRHKFPKQK
jgi:hypothetical protein